MCTCLSCLELALGKENSLCWYHCHPVTRWYAYRGISKCLNNQTGTAKARCQVTFSSVFLSVCIEPCSSRPFIHVVSSSRCWIYGLLFLCLEYSSSIDLRIDLSLSAWTQNPVWNSFLVSLTGSDLSFPTALNVFCNVFLFCSVVLRHLSYCPWFSLGSSIMFFSTVNTVPCFCAWDLYIRDVFVNEESNPSYALLVFGK